MTSVLINQLGRIGTIRPTEVDHLLSTLAAQPRWATTTTDPTGDPALEQGPTQMAVALLAILAAIHDTAYARATVRAWLTNPVDHPRRAKRVTLTLRALLNPADLSLREAQARVFDILAPAASVLRDAWVQANSSTANEEEVARATRALTVAATLAQQLYFASGAFDGTTSKERPARGDLDTYHQLALPLLRTLADVHHPTVTQHLVQTLDHLSECEPRESLLIAVRAVRGDAAYARERLGLDAALKLVKRYLAEHQTLIGSDNTCLSGIRAILESFVRLGWDQALDLTEDLDDRFR